MESTYDRSAPSGGPPENRAKLSPDKIVDWLKRAVQTIDSYGPAAWVGTVIAAFIIFAPLGVLAIVYLIWSGRMGLNWSRAAKCRRASRAERRASEPTGNAAFDAYRTETLARLDAERDAFESFLERLRAAKDQSEFDQFMAERRAADQAPQASQAPQPPQGAPFPG